MYLGNYSHLFLHFKVKIPLDILLMVILADHLEVPSRTLCLMLFMCWTWIVLEISNTLRISSKISGLFLSRIFILSFMAMMMCCVRSSAPVLELFSAAPGGKQRRMKQEGKGEWWTKSQTRSNMFKLCFSDGFSFSGNSKVFKRP